jgi:PPOX class probable F420-dependent enzyme
MQHAPQWRRSIPSGRKWRLKPALLLSGLPPGQGPVDTVKGVTDTSNGLPRELRDLIESGPLVHLSTINADGSPQVSVIWVGLDGDDLVSGHMSRYAKVRNIERDPRVVLSFTAPRDTGAFLNPYAVLRARATVEHGDGAWDLLNRLTKVYLSPSTDFPAPKGPGYTVRYSIERIGGVGPWVA